MSVAVVGINHRTLPLAGLEPLIVAPSDVPKALADLVGRTYLDEVVVLSTCMRTEVYAVVNRFHGAMADIREFLARWSGQPPEQFSDHLYSYFDEGALTHLFRVAAGLDSVSVGEPEVLGQVRMALQVARTEGACGPVLTAAFTHAVQAGRRARAETAISRGSTSVAHAAVELAAASVPAIASTTALVVGLGEVGETAARALAGAVGASRLVLVNRSGPRAIELAEVLGTQALPWESLSRAVADADIVVCATAGETMVLGEELVAEAMAQRPRRPLVLVDLAVPRQVAPGVTNVPGVSLFNMDDVGHYVSSRVDDRRGEIPAVELIVAEEIDRYNLSMAARSVAPLVAQLYERAEEVRRAELARLGAGPWSQADLEALTHRVVAKLLHEPTVRLKRAVGTAKGDALAEAFRDLFDIQP